MVFGYPTVKPKRTEMILHERKIKNIGASTVMYAYDISTPYGCQFMTHLLHFQFNFLLMALEKQERRPRCLVPATQLDDSDGPKWKPPAAVTTTIWEVNQKMEDL